MGRRGRPRKRLRARRGDDDDEEEAPPPGPGEEEMGDAVDDLFTVGTKVEVRSDDPGFFASYYEATVAGHQHGNLGYVVAYSTLNRRDDGGDSPLRELAAAANVRPRPPQAPDPPRRGFAVHDMVEALHDGGWWAGVVVGTPEADTAPSTRRVYKVCFPTTRELLDFEETALRPNRVFLHHRWVPAAKAKNGTPLFKEFCQVEVSRSTKTFGKYWSPATVLKVIGVSSFLVQYRDVREDGEPVTEILDSQYIRPARDIVHMNSKYRFAPSSHVEVFHEGSWWPGIILKVLDIESPKKYVVKIKSQEEADENDVECLDSLTVDHTQLRPRYDWYHGKWVRCLSEKPVNKGPQSTSRKRRASAVLAMTSCNDSVDIAGLAPCVNNDSISYESGSHLIAVNKDVVSEPFWPGLVSNENDPAKHKASTHPENVLKQQGSLLSFESHLPVKRKTRSYTEKVVKQQVTMLSFESHLTLPSQSSASGLANIKYDPKLHRSDQLERSSSQMVAEPSAPQAGQLQASLFGSFGSLRPLPLPQTPSFIIPSHTIESGSILGSNKALIYQEKQSTDGCCDGMVGINQNTSFGSFSAFKNFAVHGEHGMSKKEHTSAMLRYAAEGSKFIENSEIIQLSFIGTSNCTEAQPDDTLIAPQGATVSYAAENVQSIENSEITKLSSIGTGNCTEAQPEDTLIATKGAMVRYAAEGVQSIKNSEITQLSAIGTSNCTEAQPEDTLIATKGAMVRYAAEGVQSIENSEITQLSSIVMSNCTEAQLEDTLIAPKGATVRYAAEGTSNSTEAQPGDTLITPKGATVRYAAEGVQSIENSEITQLSSIGMSNCTEAQPEDTLVAPKGATVMYEAEGVQSIENSDITQSLSCIGTSNSTEAQPADDTLIAPKGSEGTPMSKFVRSRTSGCSDSLLQRSRNVQESIIAERPSESSDVEEIPFVKTSPLWAQIEAMEVFRKVPQRPNFHKWQHHVPEVREGMALGLMLSFATLAESVKRLCVEDEDAVFEEKMKGVSLLEADGFDVEHLRSRLQTLLRIKKVRAKLHSAIKDLEEKFCHEETQRHTQIGVLNMTVRQLELQACLFRRMMQSAISQQMSDASEISRLRKEVSLLEQPFSSATASPW